MGSILVCIETVISFCFSVQDYYCYADAAFTSSCKKLLRPHQPKLKEERVSLIEQSTIGTSVSSIAPYVQYVDKHFLLDAFTTSSGKNLETEKTL